MPKLTTAVGNPFDRRSNTKKTYYAFRSKKHPHRFFVGIDDATGKALTSTFLEDCQETDNLFECDENIQTAELPIAESAFDIIGFVPEKEFELVKVEVAFTSKITQVRFAEKEMNYYNSNLA